MIDFFYKKEEGFPECQYIKSLFMFLCHHWRMNLSNFLSLCLDFRFFDIETVYEWLEIDKDLEKTFRDQTEGIK